MRPSPLLVAIKGSGIGILIVAALLAWNLGIHEKFGAPALDWAFVLVASIATVGMIWIAGTIAGKMQKPQ